MPLKTALKAMVLSTVLLGTLSVFSQTAPPQFLNEKVLLDKHRKSSVQTLSNEATVAQQRLATSLVNEDYQAKLFTELNVTNSQEQSLNSFQPILTPYEDWRVGVEKKLSLGTKVSVETFGTKYSFQDNSVSNATQVGARVKAELDLWKNFFGRLDRAQLNSAEAQGERAELQLKINQRASEVALRKTYWSYVAAAQSIELTQQLVKSAEAQSKDARNRAREGAADKGEVARYTAQVESRNSSLLLFQYEYEVIGQYFERQIEGFKASDWKLDTNVDQAQSNAIGQCLGSILQQKTPSLEHTSYDEMVNLLETEAESENRIARAHGDIDLALVGQYQSTGVSDSYGSAREDLSENQRGGTAVGLRLTVPLGGDSRRSEKALIQLKKNSIEAQKISLKNDLRSTHQTMLKSIALLNSGLERQKENSKAMDTSYREMLRKFRQGRVPVSTLIIEQDGLFQSQLQEITIKRQIAHVLLDYFTVFNSYPCAWNQI